MVGRKRSWTDKELIRAVADSHGTAGVLRLLRLRAAGGNYAIVQKRIQELRLDVSHWTRQGHWKGKHNPYAPKIPLTEILKAGSAYQSNKLRRRLIAEGLMAARCTNCGLDEWLGRPIPLELDHVDGDRMNHELGNLRLVCPNCHALTPTYRGKNVRRKGLLLAKQPNALYVRGRRIPI
jgi:hypothetical protein